MQVLKTLMSIFFVFVLLTIYFFVLFGLFKFTEVLDKAQFENYASDLVLDVSIPAFINIITVNLFSYFYDFATI
jgi:hypothetical protein